MRQPTFSAAACTSNAEEDRALVQRYMQGDREAFTLLVVRYQRPIYNAAFWVLRKGEDASDVSQTVFLKAAQQINDYDPRYKFFSWLYRIAINESLNLLRKRKHEDELEDDDEFPSPESEGPESQLNASERARCLQAALMKLSVHDRVVISLRHFSDCSYQEIAQILDLDDKTVKSRLFEARQRLRVLLTHLEGPAHERH